MQIESYLPLFNIVLSSLLFIALFSLKTKGHKWLSLLLLCYTSIGILRWGMFLKSTIIVVYLPVILFPAIMFIGSAILIYLNSVLFDFDIKIRYHLIAPLTLSFIHIFLLILYPNQMTIDKILNKNELNNIYTAFLEITSGLYITVLISIAFVRIVKYRKNYKDNYSDEKFKNSRWLVSFVLLNLILLAGKTANIIIAAVAQKGISFSRQEDIIVIIMLLFVIYYLITKPEVISYDPVDNKKNKSKYAKMSFSESERRKIAAELENYMINEQAFLEEDISLAMVADELNTKSHFLSMAINIEFEKNFFNYINQHRVEYAMKLLRDPDEKDNNILTIAYKSGFQSKTSFNTYFKKLTGLTPSKFRSSNMQSR